MLANQQIAIVFREIADAMEVLGEDRFKVQAYRRAADTIVELPRSIADYYYPQAALDEIPGVGKAIAAKIKQLLETGKVDLHERLKQEVPAGLIAVMRVPGVGPKTAMRLFRELGIADIATLQAAATEGRLATLKGLGSKLEQRILQSLDEQQAQGEQWLLGEAWPLAERVLQDLRASDPSIVEASIAGSLRRAAPTVGDIDLVVAAPDPIQTLNQLPALTLVAAVEQMSGTTGEVRLHNGCRCSVVVVEPDRWGAALVLWTGGTEHRAALLELAAARGLRLAADGLWQGMERLPCRSEQEVYGALGLPWIPPELREDLWGMNKAQGSGLPPLIEQRNIKADMHMHTSWSDGVGSVLERAEACLARGYRYAVITDHSAYMGMVQGLDAARLREQRAEIHAANAELQRRGVAFRLLQGSEVDILPDGSLALADEVLATLDWVIAAPHVSLKQERSVATDRLIRAIRNPYVDCIGHPTGRLLLRRAGSDLDMERVLHAAAEYDTVLEIDGAYPRLDLDASHARQALEMGIKLAVDSDAHQNQELDQMRWGVLTARRSGATAQDVINTWEWQEIEDWKLRRRAQRAAR